MSFGQHTCPQHHETTENHFSYYKIIFISFDLIIMFINTVLQSKHQHGTSYIEQKYQNDSVFQFQENIFLPDKR